MVVVIFFYVLAGSNPPFVCFKTHFASHLRKKKLAQINYAD
jgi:hypothetical protein